MQWLFDLVAQPVEVPVGSPFAQQLVTGLELVGEPEFDRPRSVPVFTRRHAFQIKTPSVAGHGVLEQRVYVLEFLFEFGAVGRGILAEHRHGALVLPGRYHLEVDTVTVEHAVEIGYLSENADGPEDREGRRINSGSHTRHQVTTRCRYFVHANIEADVPLAQAGEL